MDEDLNRHYQTNFEAYLRLNVKAFLEGQMSLRDLNRWLAPNCWDMEARGIPKSIRSFAYGIQALIWEHQDGCWTKDELKSQLNGILDASLV